MILRMAQRLMSISSKESVASENRSLEMICSKDKLVAETVL